MDGCRGARRPLWMAVGSLESIVDGCRERVSRCGQLYGELVEAVVKNIFITEH